MIHFVGAGPGAPDLITVVGRNVQPIMDIYKFTYIVYKMIIKYL